MVSYNVYLTDDDTDPEANDQHDDWIAFTCKVVTVGFMNNTDIEKLPQHTSVKIPLGEMEFKVTLDGCLFQRIHTPAAGSTSWNNFVDFMGEAALSDGMTVYLWVKVKMGEDAAAAYMQFFNGDGDMGNYMQCIIKQFKFTLDATTQNMVGTIMLEEEWSS